MKSRLTVALLCTGVWLCPGLAGPAIAAGADAPAPHPAKAANPDKVIADILSVSGMRTAFDKTPESLADGFSKGMQEGERKNGAALPPDLQQAMVASVRESFTAKGFVDRVTRAMKQDYNEKRYQELLADLSTPVARRMAELEVKGNPSDQEMAAYLQTLANNPLPAQRIDLIHRLDVASRASDLVSTVVLSINKGVLRGMAGANGRCVSEGQMARAEAAMVKQMDETKDSYSGAMRTTLTYTYRNASDADLAEYVRIYEKENSKQIHDVIYRAMVEEYSAASARMGQSIMKAIRTRLAASGNHACDSMEAADKTPNATRVADAATPTAPASGVEPVVAPPAGEAASGVEGPKSSIPLEKRKGGDITQCLEAGNKSDKDIAACAEKYRP